MEHNDIDPKGLIRESYRIDDISAGECRSIFLDWALSLPMGADVPGSIKRLLAFYGPDHPDHPMNDVLRAGLADSPKPTRRGGWRAVKR